MTRKTFAGRYKLYKTGTAKLADWLAKSGSRCCDVGSIIKSFNSGLEHNAKASNEPAQIKIRTVELLQLARAIADSDPPHPIPLSILTIARDVIEGREACAQWYAGQDTTADGSLEMDNSTHRHFINVLREVVAILDQARVNQESNASSADEKSDIDIHGSIPAASQPELATVAAAYASSAPVSNPFHPLVIEEPSQTPLGQDLTASEVSVNATIPSSPVSSSTPSPAPASAPVPVCKPLDDLEFDLQGLKDPAFATWCYLHDLNDVRTLVKSTWIEYSKGLVSFLVASSITDNAFGLLRCADKDFQVKSPFGSTDYDDLMAYLRLADSPCGNIIWLCPSPSTAIDTPQPRPDTNLAELLCPVAALVVRVCQVHLDCFCKAILDDAAPPQSCSNGHPCRDDQHRFHDFQCVLSNLGARIYEIGHSHEHYCHHVVLDEFILGLARAHGDHDLPIWLVVACQIYLDIYDLIGDHVSQITAIMKRHHLEHKAVLDQLTEYTRSSGDCFFDVRGSLQELSWAANPSKRFQEEEPCSLHASARPKSDESVSVLEKHLPAHAGAVLLDVKASLCHASSDIANHRGLVLSAAFLYKTLRTLGLLDVGWHDMDFVLSTMPTKRSLVTKCKTGLSPGGVDLDGTAQRYLAAFGLTRDNVSRGGRLRSGALLVLQKDRKVGVASPLLGNLGSPDREGLYKKCGTAFSKCQSVEVILRSLAASDSPGSSSRQYSFSPAQLLATFKAAIIKDEPFLNFDFAGFTVSCARLLDAMAMQVGPLIGTEPRGVSRGRVGLVTRLLATDTSSATGRAMAAEMLRCHISLHGRDHLQKAFDASSGRIPRHLRPCMAVQSTDDKAGPARARTIRFFDLSKTKYTCSGNAMAAYHPDISSEICTRGGQTCQCEARKETGGGSYRYLPPTILREALVQLEARRDEVLRDLARVAA